MIIRNKWKCLFLLHDFYLFLFLFHSLDVVRNKLQTVKIYES